MTGSGLEGARTASDDPPACPSDAQPDDWPDDRSDVPPAVRSALVQAASDALGTSSRSRSRVAACGAPVRAASARVGGRRTLWAALDQEDGFRSSVARVWAQASPDLAAQVVDEHRGAVRRRPPPALAPGGAGLADLAAAPTTGPRRHGRRSCARAWRRHRPRSTASGPT